MKFNDYKGPIKYLSDPHFGHTNIIEYCARPFPAVWVMDNLIWTNIETEDSLGTRLVFCGDMFFNIDKNLATFKPLDNARQHLILFGNHDKRTGRAERSCYYPYAGTLVGEKKTWRTHTVIIDDFLQGQPVKVLVSHEPQKDLMGCDVNVYGHHHNNMVRFPDRFVKDYAWLLKSSNHANAGVELHNYRPVSLDELFPNR